MKVVVVIWLIGPLTFQVLEGSGGLNTYYYFRTLLQEAIEQPSYPYYGPYC